MKLKTLLLGSAASLMAVTSSFAADAVVAEPEAVEYVRVCDAYGAGYFYIPGTERCMQISGEVRFQYSIADTDNGLFDDVDGNAAYRARLAVRTANESDFGTIRTYIRFETSGNDPDGFANTVAPAALPGAGSLIAGSANRATFLQEMTLAIGGFQAGIADNYWTTNSGYGILGAINDGYYGYDQAIYAQYTYEIAGFAVTAGLEQTLNDVPAVAAVVGPPPVPATAGYTYAENPNLYIGANYGGSWGQVAATLYYDNRQDDFDYKVGVDLIPFEGFRAEAFYLGGDGSYTTGAGGAGADYAYGVGAQYTFGSITPYLLYTGTDGANTDYVAGGLIWRPASTDGLVLQGEARYNTEDTNLALAGEQNATSYTFRLIKSF